MAKTKWLPFAQLAREVTEAMVPAYRSRSSKHVFTQPQLLTLLCLMRHQGWTFREFETWLAGHRELLEPLGLKRVPDHTTLCRFQKRLEVNLLDHVLTKVLYRLTRENRYYGSNLSDDLPQRSP